MLRARAASLRLVSTFNVFHARNMSFLFLLIASVATAMMLSSLLLLLAGTATGNIAMNCAPPSAIMANDGEAASVERHHHHRLINSTGLQYPSQQDAMKSLASISKAATANLVGRAAITTDGPAAGYRRSSSQLGAGRSSRKLTYTCPEGWFPNGQGTACFYIYRREQKTRNLAQEYCIGHNKATLPLTFARTDATWLASKMAELIDPSVESWVGLRRIVVSPSPAADGITRNNNDTTDERTALHAIRSLSSSTRDNEWRWIWDNGTPWSGGPEEPVLNGHDADPNELFHCASLTPLGELRARNCDDLEFAICSRSIGAPVLCDESNRWLPFLGKCYKVIADDNDWDSARTACEAEAATLAVVDSQQENAHIGDLAWAAGKELWIDLVQVNESHYVWESYSSEGRPDEDGLNFEWIENEPECYPGNVGAGFMMMDGNPKWASAPRYAKMGAICEKQEGACAIGWAEGPNGTCYLLDLQTTVTHGLNDALCAEMDTQPLRVTGRDQDLFLLYAVAPALQQGSSSDLSRGLWLGLEEIISNSTETNVYLWASGDVLDVDTDYHQIKDPAAKEESCFFLAPAAAYEYSSRTSSSSASNKTTHRDDDQLTRRMMAAGKQHNTNNDNDDHNDDDNSINDDETRLHRLGPMLTAMRRGIAGNRNVINRGKLTPSWNRASCTQSENFLACQAPVGRPIVVPPEEQYSCPDGWTLYLSYCYLGVDGGEYGWAVGEKTCSNTNAGAHLVSIYSQVEQGVVYGLVQQMGDVWIGLNNRNQEGHWVWSDGGPSQYNNWLDDNRTLSCAFLRAEDGGWHVDDCKLLKKIFCKMSADKDHQIEPPATDIWSTSCGGAGWKEDPSTGRCYKLVPESLSWWNANENCKAEGGELLSINSNEEQTFINAWAAADDWGWWELWTGGQDQGSEGGWRWSDGSAFVFVNWQDGQPDNFQDLEDCLELTFVQGATGRWNDLNCNQEWGSVCEKPGTNYVTPPPPGMQIDTKCPLSWKEFDGNCYKIENGGQVSWDNAREMCQLGDPPSDLAIVHSRAENEFLKTYFTFSLWLGLREVERNNSWYEWVDGSAMVFHDFPDDEPNSADEECVELRNEQGAGDKNGRWNDRDCEVQFGFVCEFEPRVCPMGFEYYDGGCYLFPTEPAPTRGQAAFWCMQYNERYSKIVSVDNAYDNNYLRERISRGDSFIGLLRAAENATGSGELAQWLWDDGVTATISSSNGGYANWAPGEPQIGDENDPWSCAKIQQGTGLWYSVPCMTEAYYVCEFRPTHTYGCPVGWDNSGDSCFQFVDEGRAWDQARADCRVRGGDLAAIRTRTDQEFLGSMTGSDPNAPACPDGWLEHNGLCYAFLENTAKPFDEARAECMSSGLQTADLAWIQTMDQYNFVKGHMGQGVYLLGMDRRADPDRRTWRWAFDGSNASLTEWDDGEPAPGDSGRDCACIAPPSSKWRTVPCEEPASFICAGKTNKRAVNRWIGLNDLRRENTFEWSSGDEVTYTAWAPTKPQKHSEDSFDCVIADHANRAEWANVACDYFLPYVCSKPLQVEPLSQGTEGCDLLDDLGFEASCYSYSLNPWTQAAAERDVCQSASVGGRTLAAINDVTENLRLASWLGTQVPDARRFWLGLVRSSSSDGEGEGEGEGNFQWSTGEPLTFTNWAPGHPVQAFAGSCVFLSTSPDSLGQWFTTDCNSAENYPLCEGPRHGFTKSTPAPTSPLPDKCPDGWAHYQQQCYKLFRFPKEQQLTWVEAQQYCVSLSSTGNLASFFTTHEETLVFDLSDPAVAQGTGLAWIGLQRFSGGEGWKWIDGTAVNHVNWKPNEPPPFDSAEGDRERCAAWDGFDGSYGWVAYPCETATANVACEMRAGTEPVTMTIPTTVPLMGCNLEFPDWYYLDRHCYFVAGADVNDEYSRTWHEARDWCRSKHPATGELVSIHSHREQALLTQLAQLHPSIYAFYIGLKRDGQSQQFLWSDDTEFDFPYWTYGEPNDWLSQEGCAELITSTGYWNDRNCGGRTGGFMCKLCRDECEGRTQPPPTPPPPGFCRDGWTYFNGRCYRYYPPMVGGESNWDTARVFCEDMGPGSHMASIHTPTENAFLHALLYVDAVEATEPGWIGLHDMYGSAFEWSDETSFDFVDWDVGHPQNEGGLDEGGNPTPLDCVAVNKDNGRWRTAFCGSSGRGYVCKQHPDPSITEELPRPMCDGDFSSFYRFGQACYLPVNEDLSWDEAEARCSRGLNNNDQLDNTHLATLNDLLTLHYTGALGFSKFGKPMWIGMRFNQASSTYRWADGVPVHFTNWAQGHPPPTPPPAIDCAIMETSSLAWYVTTCAQPAPFICKHSLEAPIIPIISGKCPDGSWMEFGGEHCYKFHMDESVAWAEADRLCKEEGGNLASIHSPEEAEHIYLAAIESNSNYWIGMTETEGGLLEWSDGSAVDFQPWNDGEPNMPDEKCVEIVHSADFKWNDAFCNMGNRFICKIQKHVDVVTQTAKTPLPGTSSSSTPTRQPGDGTTSTHGTRQPLDTTSTPTRLPDGSFPSTTPNSGGPTTDEGQHHNLGGTTEGLSGGAVAAILISMLLAFAIFGFLTYNYLYHKERVAQWRSRVSDVTDGIVSSVMGRARDGDGAGGFAGAGGTRRNLLFWSSPKGTGYQREYGAADDEPASAAVAAGNANLPPGNQQHGCGEEKTGAWADAVACDPEIPSKTEDLAKNGQLIVDPDLPLPSSMAASRNNDMNSKCSGVASSAGPVLPPRPPPRDMKPKSSGPATLLTGSMASTATATASAGAGDHTLASSTSLLDFSSSPFAAAADDTTAGGQCAAVGSLIGIGMDDSAFMPVNLQDDPAFDALL